MRQTRSAIRVAYLTGEYPRASDVWIQREIASLRSLGVVVDTFAVRRPADTHMVGPEQRAERKRTTYLFEQLRSAVGFQVHLRLAARSPGRYLRGLRLALATRRPGFAGLGYQAAYFAEAGILANEISRRGIPHLHNHFGDSSCSVAMLASELGGFTYSFTLHSPGVFYDPRAWQLGTKIERAAFCTCISRFCRAQAAIHADLDHHDRLHIVHCGVDADTYSPLTHEGQGRRLLFVGRLADLKGVTVLLEALQRVKKEIPDVELTIIGDGPDRGHFESSARKLDVADRVDFVGARSQREVAEYLTKTDVFVLPSFAEGVPVTLMEAMAAAVPVVATKVGGVAELVEHGANGLLVEPGDAATLAEALVSLLDDPGARNRFGAAGRATVEADFANDAEATRLKLLFANLPADGVDRAPMAVRPELPS